MRKILTFSLALAMIFALSSCGLINGTLGSGSSSDTASSGISVPSVSGAVSGEMDIGSILAGNGDSTVIYSGLNEAQKQAFVDAAKEEGAEVTFNADGSTTIKEKDGSVTTQKPDGTWVYTDADGNEGQVGGNWPDNEYTKLIPKPGFAILAAGTESDGFSVTFSNATAEQIRAYVEEVKKAGFTENQEVTDQEFAGMLIYSYTASNSSGYEINVFSSAGIGGLTITRSE